MNIIQTKIDVNNIFTLQKKQYPDKLRILDSVPASSSKLCKVNVASHGHFYCTHITGKYSTLTKSGANIVDNGVCSLRFKLSDGQNQRPLFSDFISMDLLLTPGRAKNSLSTGVLTDAPGNLLYEPLPLGYAFVVNSDILAEVKNEDTQTDNYFELCFWGIRCYAIG